MSEKEPSQLGRERTGGCLLATVQDQVISGNRGEPVVSCENDSSIGACLLAVVAKEALAEIYSQRVVGYSLGRTGISTGMAASLTLRSIDQGASPEAHGQLDRFFRETRGSLPLL